MDHKNSVEDLEVLLRVAKGGPHDCSEKMEEIAHTLMRAPNKKLATDLIESLIEDYYNNGDASGRSLAWSSEARFIFEVRGLMGVPNGDDSND